MPMRYYRSPLEDIYDPPQRDTGMQLATPSPEEEASLLSGITGGAMTGLQYAGDVLDKTFGGRAIRGLLGGHPEELASLLPLSDTLGLTDIRNRVSGHDLMRQAGVTTGSETGDTILGIGTEIALDPATYLTFGGSALTEAGRAAAKAGILPKGMLGRIRGVASVAPEAEAALQRLGYTAGDIIGKPLGGVAGIGMPFRDPSVVLGTGEIGQKIAGVTGRVGDAIKYSAPGRYTSALFDLIVQGKVNEAVQRELRGAHAEDVARMMPASRMGVGQLIQDAPESLLTDPMRMRSAAEGVGSMPSSAEEAGAIARALGINTENLARMQEAGVKITGLEDMFGQHFPRYLTPLGREAAGSVGKPLSTRPGAAIRREDWLRDIPGATETIQRMAADPRLAGVDRTLGPAAARATIADEYFAPFIGHQGPMKPAIQELERILGEAPYVISPEAVDELHKLSFLWDKAGNVARHLGNLDPGRAGPQGIGLFANHPLLDLLHASESAAQTVANAEAVKRLFSDPAQIAKGMVDPNGVPISRAISMAGLGRKAKEDVLDNLIAHGLLQEGAKVRELKNFMLPSDLVQQATTLRDVIRPSEAVAGPLRAIDAATSLNKAFQTSLWPAFHVRNLISSTYQSLRRGSDPALLAESMGMMTKLRNGEAIEGIAQRIPEFAGMTDAQATRALGLEMFSHKASGRYAHGFKEITGGSDIEELQKLIPGMSKEPGLLDSLGTITKGRVDELGQPLDTVGQRWNPFNVSGFGGVAGIEKRNIDQFAPMVAGRQIGNIADDVTRGAMYLERRLMGYAPEAAAEATTAAHFDYSALSDFERKVMRRLIPFYSWQRKNIPMLAQDLLEQPGGLTGQAVRASSDLRGEDRSKFIPPYLGGGLAIPLGAEQGGNQKFLTKLDLPYEDPLSYITPGVGGSQRFAEKLAGNLNPLLKGPLELLTGRQFYSGRELNDLYGVTGSTMAEQALMNLPTSRIYTTARTLADPRKSTLDQILNLLTGARVSDVDMERQRSIVERDVLNQYMKTDPRFRASVDYYVRPEFRGQLNQEEEAVLALSRLLAKRARDEQKAKQP